MEARAVSAERSKLAPLADLGLLVCLAATPVLTLWAGSAVSGWAGLLVGAGGVATALLVGRVSLGTRLTVGLVVATWLTLAFCCYVALIVLLATCGADHSGPRAPLVGMGVVFAGLGLWSLRTRFRWGVPLAVVLAFVVGLTLVFTLPGTPAVCD